MREPLMIAAVVLLVAWMAIPAGTSDAQRTGRSVNSLAIQECREERRFERSEFRQDYGGTNTAALRRCIREQKREARLDCLEERREDRGEYRREYGTGKAAFARCLRDELR